MPAEAAFNPLQALQTLLSPVTPAKQRVKAAQQLEQYFRLLTPTPTLLLSYEPYLPLLAAELASPTASKGAQELQPVLLALLLALSSHNPTGFGDWIAGHASVGNEPWLVQWSYALLLQTEKQAGSDGQWDEGAAEFIEFDRVLARVLQMWRTLLDHTADVALVDQLVKYLHALLFQQDEAERWHDLMLKKLQTHFVDIADVMIGWMMSTGPLDSLREDILMLLNHFGTLWADNSVFSLQLLNSFADVRGC
jgi:hypothetical protein